jgi:NAD(P)-dependent dehydrogenase (short-subunit alcohol dehydrogenase family)
MSSQLRDKVFIVTGASEGLGRALATALAAAGCKMTLAARNADGLEAAATAIQAAGGDAFPVPTDVTSDEQVQALVDRTVAHFGRLDGLVNNVGLSMRGAALDTTPDDFRRLLELNLLATVRCTRAAAGQIIERRGHIVNIGSLAAKSAARWMGAYPAAKAALGAYTQQLRLELAPQGVHVLLVCPGPIARDKPRTYGAEELPNLPPTAQQPGGGVKTRTIAPEALARRIVTACERRQPELIVPGKARLLFALAQVSPRLGDWLLTRFT